MNNINTEDLEDIWVIGPIIYYTKLFLRARRYAQARQDMLDQELIEWAKELRYRA